MDSPGKNTGVGCHSLLQGSSNPGFEPTSLLSPACLTGFLALAPHDASRDRFYFFAFQTHCGRQLPPWNWKKLSSWKESMRNPCALSCSVMSDSVEPMNCSPLGSSAHGESPGKNIGVGCHALFRGSSQPRVRTQVSHIACRFFTIWATKEDHEKPKEHIKKQRHHFADTVLYGQSCS